MNLTILLVNIFINIHISISYLYWFPKPWKTRINAMRLKPYYPSLNKTNLTCLQKFS